jgi:hypothetical protein
MAITAATAFFPSITLFAEAKKKDSEPVANDIIIFSAERLAIDADHRCAGTSGVGRIERNVMVHRPVYISL